MADPYIPASDLPRVTPGAFDSVVGVDEATGAARRFPMPISGAPKAYETVSDLPASADEGTPAYVNSDPTAANNGLWAYIGGVWVQSGDRTTGLEGRVSSAESDIGALEAIDAGARLTAEEAATVAADGRLDALETIDAGTRLTQAESALSENAQDILALEGINAGSRLDAVEAINAGARLDAEEAATTDLDARLEDVESVLGESDPVLAVVDDQGFTGFEVTADRIASENAEVSASGVRMGAQSLDDSDDYALALEDEQGNVGFTVDTDGGVRAAKVAVSGQWLDTSRDYALAVADENGFVGFAVTTEGELVSRDPADSDVFTDAEINEANALGIVSARNVANDYDTEVARPIWDYTHFIEYGQSLSTGFEGWPALSKTPKLGNLMLGDSPRPASRTDPAFVPVGGVDVFEPLKAVVQDATTGATILDDATVAALTPGAGNEGESPVVGMTNFAKRMHNQRAMVANDTRTFIASSCGRGGRTIEELSKGADPELYLRLTQAVTKAKALADGESKTYGVGAVAFLQGEANYAGSGDATLAGYKALLLDLHADIVADVGTITGQDDPPLFITYQTGASYTSDTNDLAIGMAQWELAQENNSWVLATPVYPYTDKGGHLDPNGYRWVGCQFAKVWHRVVELGQGWKPLSPLQATVRGREVLIAFHVPVAPLAFDLPYVLTDDTNYADKGFAVFDGAGQVALASVEIVADCVVKLTLAADPSGTVEVRYAGKATFNGNGCLRDSDATVASEVYEYNAGTGQYPDANIPALVGNPYPLHNWCIAFHMTAEQV